MHGAGLGILPTGIALRVFVAEEAMQLFVEAAIGTWFRAGRRNCGLASDRRPAIVSIVWETARDRMTRRHLTEILR